MLICINVGDENMSSESKGKSEKHIELTSQ
jgi:hypothetical protein